MTDQKSKLEALELTITIIDDLKANVREKTFESYLTNQRNILKNIEDQAKQEINYVIPRTIFIQAHSILKAYEDAMSKMIEAYGENNSYNLFYQYATARILKAQLWAIYYEPQ